MSLARIERAPWRAFVPPATATPGADDAALELGYRFAAVQVGRWLGWASIVVVLGGLALDVGGHHRLLLVGLTLAAAAGNTLAMVIPWRAWLATRRGRALLDVWCAGLVAFVALLVANGGTNFALLLFLTAPFIAVVQVGWRRGLWLGVTAATCSFVTTLVAVPAGATAIRMGLVAVTVGVTLLLVRALRSAAVRADFERALAREADHRIKNDLQTAADLLLLGRPDGPDAAAFDETAERIRSIATVHRLLSESAGSIDGGALLRSITANTPVPVQVEADPAGLDPTTAQRLGIVANELVTNACRHGAPPIVIRLRGGSPMQLTVEDSGRGARRADSPGLGLDLVRRMVERGLHGRFELSALATGGTRAEVVFPPVS
jgi:two-component sensor histidine kinase